MAESVLLKTQPREPRGSGDARRLRRKGFVPGIVYGHKEANICVGVPGDLLLKIVRQGTHVVDVDIAGKQEKALIREIQWDYLGKDLIHVDLERVSAEDRITVSVPLEFRGTAPGIATGGVLDVLLHTVQVECLAMTIPNNIRVNVGELLLGQAIHIRDLVLPEGVKAMGNPDTIVVHVTLKQVEAALATGLPGEVPGAPEPEIIGRKVASAAEGEESE